MPPNLVGAADLILFSTEPYPFTEADLDEFAREQDCPRAKLRIIDGEAVSWYGPRAIAGLAYLGEFASARSGDG